MDSLFNEEEFFLHFPEEYCEEEKLFFSEYLPEYCGTSPLSEMKNLKPKSERVCRFCGKRYPLVTFNSVAHIIPNFFGNKYFVSDSECDNCNNKFSRIEKNLDNYIGIIRSISATEGKNGIPTIKSKDGKIESKSINFFGANVIQFGSTQKDPSEIKYDSVAGNYIIEYKKQPYIPIQAYKAILKMALSMIDDSELPHFKIGIDLLTKKNTVESFIDNSFFFVYKHEMKYECPASMALLFKRKNEYSEVPPYTFVFIYKRLMFQIFVSFNNKYLHAMNGKKVQAPIFPPFFRDSIRSQIDLSGRDKTFETEFVKIQFAPNRINDIMGIDPVSLKMIDSAFDPNQVTSFIIHSDPNFSIKIKNDNFF